MADELKHCPVLSCGMAGGSFLQNSEEFESVVCQFCGFRSEYFATAAKAIDAWNALERREDVRRKALEEVCKMFCDLCKSRAPEFGEPGGLPAGFYHRYENCGISCDAEEVRQLMAKESWDEFPA